MKTLVTASGFVITGVILTILVALLHLAIGGLEMFGKPDKQAQAFKLSPTFLTQPEAKIMLANQGIYNCLLGVLLLATYAMLLAHFNLLLVVWRLLLGFIVIAGAYGGWSVTKKIWLIQMLPALVALVLICL